MRISHHAPERGSGADRGEAGVIGGMEVLPFGLLIFVVGSLLILNGWAVVDAKLTASSAAREAARSYVEAAGPEQGKTAALAAARDVVSNFGHNPNRLALTPPLDRDFVRCRPVTFDAKFTISTIRMPFIGGFGGAMTVDAKHTEIIDPLRSGLDAGSDCYGQ